MTVHRAKGLEFPVVILADLTANGTPERAVALGRPDARGSARCGSPAARRRSCVEQRARSCARERGGGRARSSTSRRRARATCSSCRWSATSRSATSWLEPLDPALYPSRRRAPHAGDARAAGLSRRSAGDSVSERPDDVVQPPLVGRARPAPPAGRRAPRGLVGLRARSSSAATRDRRLCSSSAARGRRERRALGERHPRARGVAGERAARARDGGGAVDPRRDGDRAARSSRSTARGDVAVERVERAGRAAAREALRHARARDARRRSISTPARDDVRAVAAIAGPRSSARRADEVAAAVDAWRGALAHPLLRRAAARRCACRRETPLASRLDDGTLVEGVVDVAFEEAGGWTVVDFKTDVELAGRRDEYARQVSLYARRHRPRRPASRARPVAAPGAVASRCGAGDPLLSDAPRATRRAPRRTTHGTARRAARHR